MDQYTCSQCEKKFTYRSGLSRHTRNYHPEYLDRIVSKTSDLKCFYCDSIFQTTQGRLCHMKKQHNHETTKPAKTLSCFSCSKWFAHRSSLWKHEKLCLQKQTPRTELTCIQEVYILNESIDSPSHEDTISNKDSPDVLPEDPLLPSEASSPEHPQSSPGPSSFTPSTHSQSSSIGHRKTFMQLTNTDVSTPNRAIYALNMGKRRISVMRRRNRLLQRKLYKLQRENKTLHELIEQLVTGQLIP